MKDNTVTKNWAVVLSHHLSGYSLVQNLHAADWEGNILVLKINHKGPALCEQIPKLCKVREISIQKPEDLPGRINGCIPVEDSKVIFFFDERYHRAFIDKRFEPSLKNMRFKTGAVDKLDTILDRHEFYRAIERHRLSAVPETIESGADPWRHFGGPFFFRFRETWKGMQRNPRNFPVCQRNELHEFEAGLLKKSYQKEEWCYQELLSVSEKDNVSICGWHDAKRQAYIATRKVLQHPPKNGNGDVVERIDPPAGLEKETRSILEYMDYDGPFEMEFVFDRKQHRFKVIELNPRFWLQHALFSACFDQFLIKAYTGLAANDLSSEDRQDVRFWVNRMYAVYRMAKMDFRIYPYLWKASIFVPGLKDMLHFGTNQAIGRVFH